MKRKATKPRSIITKPRKIVKTTTHVPRERRGLRPPCFQCELDIGHVCFDGIPNAKWGMES